MNKDFVGIGEASRILGLSKTSVQKLVDAGKIPAIKTDGGHRRLGREAVQAISEKTASKALVGLTNPGKLEPGAWCGMDVRHKNLKILVVEDDAAAAALISGMLTMHYPDVQMLHATDGLDAVLTLERHRPQILITDLNMAPFDGFRLLALVSKRPEFLSIATVVVSGLNDHEIEKGGGLPPNVLFLAKPLSLQRLRGFIDAHLQMYAAFSSNAGNAKTL